MTTLLVGHYVMRIPFDDLLGITSGVSRHARDCCLRQPDLSFGPGGDLLRDDLPGRHHPEDRHRPGDDCVGEGRLMVVASAWWSEIAIG